MNTIGISIFVTVRIRRRLSEAEEPDKIDDFRDEANGASEQLDRGGHEGDEEAVELGDLLAGLPLDLQADRDGRGSTPHEVVVQLAPSDIGCHISFQQSFPMMIHKLAG